MLSQALVDGKVEADKRCSNRLGRRLKRARPWRFCRLARLNGVSHTGTCKAATDQKPLVQDTKKQLKLIEPRPVFWREMKDMRMAWITRKRRRYPF